MNIEIPELTPDQREEICLAMPQFSFYTKKGKHAECFCTACQSWYTKESNAVKHNDVGNCSICQHPVQYKSGGRGMKSYMHQENFAVFYNVDGKVVIRCCEAYQTFPNEDKMRYIADISMRNVCIYVLAPGKAEKLYHNYLYGWTPYKSKFPGEPNMGMGCGCSCSYITISEDCLDDSFLKYCVKGIPERPNFFISYLCRCAVHPNLEYLVKGGFYEFAMSYAGGNACGVRINWKSNNLLKMLHIDRQELAYLKDKSSYIIGTYIRFRNKFKIDSTMAIKLYPDYSDTFTVDQIAEIMESTKLGFNDIVRYTEKNKIKAGMNERTFVHDWCDYIRECVALEYDMSDDVIIRPRNLHAAHERTSSIIRAQNRERGEKEMAYVNKKHTDMLYTDEKRGLLTVLPRSVEDIKNEGAKQHHCVGGYAERHLNGILTIMFLRKIDEPDIPYYTMEIDNKYKIVQCRGYANNVEYNGGVPKTQDIIEFEEEYAAFLKKAFIEKKKRNAKKKTQERKAV